MCKSNTTIYTAIVKNLQNSFANKKLSLFFVSDKANNV